MLVDHYGPLTDTRLVAGLNKFSLRGPSILSNKSGQQLDNIYGCSWSTALINALIDAEVYTGMCDSYPSKQFIQVLSSTNKVFSALDGTSSKLAKRNVMYWRRHFDSTEIAVLGNDDGCDSKFFVQAVHDDPKIDEQTDEHDRYDDHVHLQEDPSADETDDEYQNGDDARKHPRNQVNRPTFNCTQYQQDGGQSVDATANG